MNNQVKLIEMIQRKIDELPPFNLMRYEKGKKDAYEEVIAMLIDTPPVPTIKPGDNVYHNRFKAQGKVKKLSASGKRAYVVWFDGYAPSYVSLDSLEVVE